MANNIPGEGSGKWGHCEWFHMASLSPRKAVNEANCGNREGHGPLRGALRGLTLFRGGGGLGRRVLTLMIQVGGHPRPPICLTPHLCHVFPKGVGPGTRP